MITSNLCDYSDEYIHVKRTITIPNTAAANNANKKVIFKNCAPFPNCISKINNTQVNDAHDDDTVVFLNNLIEQSHIYSKTSGSLQQYYRQNKFQTIITILLIFLLIIIIMIIVFCSNLN